MKNAIPLLTKKKVKHVQVQSIQKTENDRKLKSSIFQLSTSDCFSHHSSFFASIEIALLSVMELPSDSVWRCSIEPRPEMAKKNFARFLSSFMLPLKSLFSHSKVHSIVSGRTVLRKVKEGKEIWGIKIALGGSCFVCRNV